jgi:hypothetical protein
VTSRAGLLTWMVLLQLRDGAGRERSSSLPKRGSATRAWCISESLLPLPPPRAGVPGIHPSIAMDFFLSPIPYVHTLFLDVSYPHPVHDFTLPMCLSCLDVDVS